MKKSDILPMRLKKARTRLGWTQEQVAEKLNISIGTLSGYERGYRSPNPDMLSRLAELYNTTTDYLLGLTDDPTPPQARPKVLDYDRYIRDAPTLPKGLERIAEVAAKYGLDLKESMRLSDLVFEKFGAPEVKYADKAAQARKNIPGTGVFRRKRGRGADAKH